MSLHAPRVLVPADG